MKWRFEVQRKYFFAKLRCVTLSFPRLRFPPKALLSTIESLFFYTSVNDVTWQQLNLSRNQFNSPRHSSFAMAPWTDVEKAFCVRLYTKTGSILQTQQKFRHYFNLRRCPAKNSIFRWSNKFEMFGSTEIVTESERDRQLTPVARKRRQRRKMPLLSSSPSRRITRNQ